MSNNTITGSSLAYRIYTLINAMTQPVPEQTKKNALDKLEEAFSFINDKNIPDTIANANDDKIIKETIAKLNSKIDEIDQNIKNAKTAYRFDEFEKKINNTKANTDTAIEKIKKTLNEVSYKLSHKSEEDDSFSLIEESVNAKLTEFTKYVQGELNKISSKINDVNTFAENNKSTVISEEIANIKIFKGKEALENGMYITYENAKLPIKKYNATGYDAFACFPDGFESEKTIYPGKTEKISLGISCNIPKGYEIQCRPRSGLSSKGILVAFGSVDEDYRGVIKAIVTNLSKDPYIVKQGDRIAQLVINKKTESNLEWAKETDVLEETTRGSSGFGSTGK